MKHVLKRVHEFLLVFGIDLRKMVGAFFGLRQYLQNYRLLKLQARSADASFSFGALRPCLDDRRRAGGQIRGHYFHQDLLVSQRIYEKHSERHVDVGSRIDGCVAHIASFRTVEVIDIRATQGAIRNMVFRQADIMAPVADDLIDYCDSLSCLHALEHFGLGRYGDSVAYDGYLLGLDNLGRMLKQGGTFYVSVPIGPQRIEFDAHRVFSLRYLLDLFDGKYRIDQFSYVDDAGVLHRDVPIADAAQQSNCGCWFGCGIFEMTKL